MAKKPAGDLGSMAITKAKAADAVPFASAAPSAISTPHVSGMAKSLTVKVDGNLYAALRAYCYEQEQATGTKLTHQQVMVEALKAFLPKPAA